MLAKPQPTRICTTIRAKACRNLIPLVIARNEYTTCDCFASRNDFKNPFGIPSNLPQSLVFLKSENQKMKKFVYLIMFIAIGVAFYEQTIEDKNVYITVVAVIIFMMGMMRLSSKTPSKNQENNEDDVQ